jgi:hypothetical protein
MLYPTLHFFEALVLFGLNLSSFYSNDDASIKFEIGCLIENVYKI